ncbi:SigE family RNA polymerase sigma factor [soil metagenome]
MCMDRQPSTSVSEVYARSCGPLIGLLHVMGGSASDAEEVAQDAFVKLLEHWTKVRDYDDIDAWLRTVAVRLLISRHRRRSVATLGLKRLAGRPIHEMTDGTDDRLDLETALLGLPITQRAVLLLHHVHDLPVDDVADLLRLPTGTVKSRLSRARAALAPQLSERSTS